MKYLIICASFIFMISCSNDSSLKNQEADVLLNQDLESRTNCQHVFAAELDKFIKDYRNFVKGGSTSTSTLGQSFRATILKAAKACNGDREPDCSIYPVRPNATGPQDNQLWCERIGNNDNVSIDDSCIPTGPGQVPYVNMAYCRLQCYIDNFDASDPTSIANVQQAFCDYIKTLNICFDLRLNERGYCDLINSITP